jgi:hypothetical protein
MLKRLAALLLLVGLCLPYGSDVRPITGVWHDLPSILFLGIPVIATLIYVLHTLVPPLAAFHDRNAAVLHAILRVVYFGLVGGYLAFAVKHRGDTPGLIDTAIALVVTGVLIVWQERRGTKAARLPLLLLTTVGVAEVAYLAALLPGGDLRVGAWIFTAGWVLGVLAEMQTLAAAPIIAHSG